jgi:hypothetical protein
LIAWSGVKKSNRAKYCKCRAKKSVYSTTIITDSLTGCYVQTNLGRLSAIEEGVVK